MYLTKWDPFETLTNLQTDIDRAFRSRLNNESQLKGIKSLLPSVDIHEDNDAYYFDAELPGLKKEDIDVKVEDNILYIKGEKRKDSEKSDKNYYRVEREYGSFARSFSLPDTADTTKVNAEYRDGVLHVKLAKKEAAKPKRIDVKVS